MKKSDLPGEVIGLQSTTSPQNLTSVPIFWRPQDVLFRSLYAPGDRRPLSPADLLHAWWLFADDLAG